MIRIALNSKKPNNYAFFCPVSRLHLTRSNPVGNVNEVTPAIERALKFETLINLDENKTEAQPPIQQQANPVSNQEQNNVTTKEDTEPKAVVDKETETVIEKETKTETDTPLESVPNDAGSKKDVVRSRKPKTETK